MKAILLNSGEGSRLMPFSEAKPKCLIKIKNETILEHQVRNVYEAGIEDMILTTGPFPHMIKNILEKRYSKINFTFVENKDYLSTNYIYSMYLLKDLIDDDILLLHGDLVFDYEVLHKLMSSKYANSTLVNRDILPPEKDFKAKVENGLVKWIGVELSQDYPLLSPMYRFNKRDFLYWLNKIDEYVGQNRITVYAENALNDILGKIYLSAVYYRDLICMEIDDLDDLRSAREKFK